MTDRFGGPWGARVKFAIIGVAIIGSAGSLLVGLAAEAALPALLAGIGCLTLVVGCAVFTIRGYTLEGRTLRIRRLLWDTQLDLSALRSVRSDPGAMRRSWRLLGNGGIFAITGWFQNRTLGRYRAFVTDPKRAIALTFQDRVVVISPDQPEQFAAVVRDTFSLHA